MFKSILEVWDYRLSTAQPLVYKGLPENMKVPPELKEGRNNWIAAIYDQGDNDQPLELFNSGIRVKKGDTDINMPDSIYEFFRSVRDTYSRSDIKELKPIVREIRRIDVIRQEATDAYNAIIKEKV